MADALGQCERPGAGAIKRLSLLPGDFRTAQHGAGTVDEEHAQVDVAALGHAAEASNLAAGMFARGEAERAGEVATGRKALEVADRGTEGGGGEQADAAGALQSLAAHVGLGKRLQTLFDRGHRVLGRRD